MFRWIRSSPALAPGALLLFCAPTWAENPPEARPKPGPVVDVAPPAAAGGAGVRFARHGEGSRSYWLFEPEQSAGNLPVVVFLHGWQAMNPGVYGAWIDHLVRAGHIVIFPRYQVDWSTDATRFQPNAEAAIADGLDVLRNGPGHARPDLERFALIGHSAGGNLAALIAATTAESGLPRPRAVVAVTPGEVKPLREPKLSGIPAETLLVVIAAEGDRIVGDHRARRIFAEATTVPRDRKLYVLFRTDRHGEPPLVADHVAPTAGLVRFDSMEGPGRAFQFERALVDALDVAGFWRIADVTLAAAFAGRTLAQSTADGALWRDMGRWSDGRPVLGPLVGTDLGEIPRVFPTNGIRLVDWTFEGLLPPNSALPVASGPARP